MSVHHVKMCALACQVKGYTHLHCQYYQIVPYKHYTHAYSLCASPQPATCNSLFGGVMTTHFFLLTWQVLSCFYFETKFHCET